MNIEKEIRLKVNEEEIEKIRNVSVSYKKETHLIDVTMGMYGFDSLYKTGYICRVRSNNNECFLEIKKYFNDNECIEKNIKVSSLKDGIDFLNLLGYEIYLILDRYREIRKYNDLILYIDRFDDIGNYLEIEYQDSNKEEAEQFINKFNLSKELQDKYGDILCKKLNEDFNYRENFNKKLNLYKK